MSGGGLGLDGERVHDGGLDVHGQRALRGEDGENGGVRNRRAEVTEERAALVRVRVRLGIG